MRRPSPPTRATLGLALALLALATSAVAQDGATPVTLFPIPGPATSITPSGLVAEGWYGGDAGNICAINATTLFCSFTDPYIGPAGLTRGTLPISYGGGNTIAIMTIDPKTRKVAGVMHYHRGLNRVDPHDDPPRPAVAIRESFFPVIAPSDRLQQVSNLDKQARIFLRRAVMAPDGNLYIFAQIGSGGALVEESLLIRITNPAEPPPSWKFDYLGLGNFHPQGYANLVTGTAAPYYFGNEAFIRGDYLYTYGFYNPHHKNLAIDINQSFSVYPLRLPLAALKSAPPTPTRPNSPNTSPPSPARPGSPASSARTGASSPTTTASACSTSASATTRRSTAGRRSTRRPRT